jgi:hypothetical protein
MRLEAHQERPVGGTSEEILGEIREFCRATQTAESTFGRLVVNDGKLVSRLRDGAKITTGTLDKVRAYLSEHRPLPANGNGGAAPAAHAANGSAAVRADIAPPGFRFFDNRQKYLLFVSTCSEKTEIANRVSLELASLQPSPPALRLFDAGVGDGTVLSRVMRALHARFPTMPLYVVAKEISYEDVRMMLEKMADRLFEHPATVLVVTNLYYAEAPWLTPRSVTSAQADLEGRRADRQHRAWFCRADRRARRLSRRELARRHQPKDRQSGLSASDRADLAARGSFLPARSDHAAARPRDGRLRPRHRLAALSGAHRRRVQGLQGGDAAGACAPAGRAADRHPFPWP